MTYAQPLTAMMGDVAKALLGNPNDHLSKPRDGLLKFGSRGSMEVNTVEGWFADYESGVKGGVLELIKHKGGVADNAGALQWLEDKGIKDREVSPQNAAQPKSTFYDYRGETGEVLYRIERKQTGAQKDFLQHGPDGRGGFHAAKGCMRGVRRVLYRLPELLAADPSLPVFLCEGEKNADRVARDGLIATTNSGGAGSFDQQYVQALADRRVVILEDNDQAGRDRTAKILPMLEGVAKTVAVLRFGGCDKDDVCDWLARGNSTFDLELKAEDALEKAAVTPAGDLVPMLDLVALSRTPAVPKAFAIERIAPLGELTMLYGPGSAGKSLLGQQLATVAAAGIPSCLGLDVMSTAAIYLTCEDDADQLHFRQERICDALRVPMADLAGKLHLASLRGALGNELATFGHENKMTPTEAYTRLCRTVKHIAAKLVVLDNVAHLFTGNENDRADVTRFVNLLNRLAGETGAAIILLGHPNKAGDEWSGSTGWNNAVRSRLYLDHDEDTDIRTLSLPKANYSKKGDVVSFRWVDWAFVRDADLPADKRAEIEEVIQAAGDNLTFMKCLDERNRQERPVSESKASRTYAPKEFADMPESKRIGRSRLEAAMERLFRLGTIERGFVYRDLGEGKDRFGLRRASADLSADVPLTPPADVPLTTRRPPPAHTLYTTYISGAAHEPAAPDTEEDGEGWATIGEAQP